MTDEMLEKSRETAERMGLAHVLRPCGRFQFTDIATGQPVPEAAIRNVDLWTA